jgi:hypothetical protein
MFISVVARWTFDILSVMPEKQGRMALAETNPLDAIRSNGLTSAPVHALTVTFVSIYRERGPCFENGPGMTRRLPTITGMRSSN